MKIFATDVQFPEAPVLLPDGGLLCVEMSAATGTITRIDPDGIGRRVLAKTGRPNGLARDRNGNIWVAESAMRAVLKMTPDGAHTTIATRCGSDEFLFLNDLAFAPNGDLYVTDSGVELEEFAPNGELNPAYRNLRYDGRVFRIDVRSSTVELVDRGLAFANGIAFGPDNALYVAETLTGNIYRYPEDNGRYGGARELFGNVIERFDPADLKGPDGMKFGADGNLYACVFGQGDITVLGRAGEVVRRLKAPGNWPTNLCFAAPGRRQIYVTEVLTGTIQLIDVGTDGYTLHG